jgi:beta-galactosidase
MVGTLQNRYNRNAMSKRPGRILLFFLASFLLFVGHISAKTVLRERRSFNEGWLFNKTTDSSASQILYNDGSWRSLTLPHDWAIEGPFKPEYNPRTGGLPIVGEAWYRKHFKIDQSAKGKSVAIEFDGVMYNASVYVNGKKVYERPYGFIGFAMDISRYINYGGNNVIAIRLNPETLSARWYPGAGIYRNAWMEIRNPVHVKHWGTQILTPVITKDNAIVKIATEIVNDGEKLTSSYSLKTSIINAEGIEVAANISEITFADREAKITQEVQVKNPKLWDLALPYRYKAVSTIFKNNTPVDSYSSEFGIRTISYSREGFFLNGLKVKIKGVCLHNDLGALGAAVNYRATERQLEIMKSMGVNAIRTSHNPASPEQLDLCDKMGILVQEEAFDCWKLPKVENDYSKYWDTWHETDLRDMIRRDRNRPSIIMWSIGNEIREQNKEDGYLLARKLHGIVKEEDASRPTTAGFNNLNAAIKNGLAAEIDLVGANYKPADYAAVMKNNTDWIVYGCETSSCVSSRGVNHLPLEKYDKHPSLQVSSYDINSPGWAYPPDVEFHFQDSLPHVIGEIVLTGFDYLGEPTPYGGKDNLTHGNWDVDWPSRSSYFGIVDLAGFPKDRFYLYQSRWTTHPMVHILPHWNWEGTGFKEIPVFCYTNCEEAELFVNGKSLGRKKMGVDKTRIPVDFGAWKGRPNYFDSPYRLCWNVPYETGEIKVIAYNKGKEAASKTIKSAKAAHGIELIHDRKVIRADGVDLCFVTVKIVDEQSNFCPLANNKIEFRISGPASIAAVDNGNAASTEPFQANSRMAFNGLCLLVLKSKKGTAGEVKIEALSTGLKPVAFTVETK